MSTQANQVLDVLTATLPDHGRGEIIDLRLPLQDYPTVVWQDKNTKTISGLGLSRRISVGVQETAEEVAMDEPDRFDKYDTLRTVTQDNRVTRGHYTMNEIEVDTNKGSAEQLNDLVREREIGCNASIMAKRELRLWSQGPASVADTVTPMGYMYCILRGSGAPYTTTGALNTGAPSGHPAGRFGLLHERHGNWAEVYEEVVRDDLVRRILRSQYKTNWRYSIPGAESRDLPDRMGWSNYAVTSELEALGEQTGDNTTHKELAWWNGLVTIHGMPVMAVPALDSDSGNPVYGIDRATMFRIVLNGWTMKRIIQPQRPNVLDTTVWKYMVSNLWCSELRRNWVVSL